MLYKERIVIVGIQSKKVETESRNFAMLNIAKLKEVVGQKKNPVRLFELLKMKDSYKDAVDVMIFR